MNRLLVVVVIVQFLIILYLAFAHFEEVDGPALGEESARTMSETSRKPEPEVRRHANEGETGHETTEVEAERSAGTEKSPASVMPETFVVYGSMRNAAGELLPGRFTFRPVDGTFKGGYADDGNYALAGLTAGTWSYDFQVEGYRPCEGELTLGDVPALRFDVTIEKAVVLRIRVLTPDGEPIGPPSYDRILGVVATAQAPVGDLPRTPHRDLYRVGLGRFSEGGGRGRRRVEMAPEFIGKLELHVDLPVHVSLVMRHIVLETKLVPVGTEIVDFVLEKDALARVNSGFRVRLVDGVNGDPIDGAVVDVSTKQTSRLSPTKSVDGVYELTGLVPGLMDLSISAPGYGYVYHMIELKRGETLDYGTVKLHPAVSCEAIVFDADGQGCAAQVKLRSFDSLATIQDTGSNRSYNANEVGELKLHGIAPGRYLLIASNPEKDLACQELIDIPARQESPLEIHLKKSMPLKIKAEVGGRDLYFARIVDAAGSPVWGMHADGDWARSISMPPGAYRFEVYRDDQLLRYQDFEAAADPVELVIP